MTLSKNEIINIYTKLCSSLNVTKLSRDVFCSKSKVTKSQIEKYFGTYSNFLKSINDPGETPFVEVSDKYSINATTGEYRFDFLDNKNIGKLIVIPRTQIYAILQAYSNFDGKSKSLNAIALEFGLTKHILKAILNALEFTHDDLPITASDLSEKSDSQITADLLATRLGSINAEFQKRSWKEIQSDANKWSAYRAKTLNPFKDVLNTWEPKFYVPKLTSFAPKAAKAGGEYIVTISDLHFGLKTSSSQTFYSNKDWTTESAKVAIKNYIESIKQDLANRNQYPKYCRLISLGDILHSVSGFTTKGTPLEVDTKGPEQFLAALNSLTELIDFLSRNFIQVNINAVSGNHDYFADWVLFTALEKTFKDRNIHFTIATERWQGFNIGKNLVVMEHGYSPFYKSKVPKGAAPKEAYIQRLMMKTEQDMNNAGIIVKNRYFFMGDLHHYVAQDYPMFEFIQLPTVVAADAYADHLNLAGSRSKQCTFLFDNDKGLIQTINHYI